MGGIRGNSHLNAFHVSGFKWVSTTSPAPAHLYLCNPCPQVVVLTQHYGDAYYHFLVENMSRLTVVLDILLENPDIKVTPCNASIGLSARLACHPTLIRPDG